MCFADFISPDGDWIGGFSVAIHGIEPHLARFKAAHDDYSDILLKALADRFAEAFAERLHAHVRTDLWGYAPGEQLRSEEHTSELQSLMRISYAVFCLKKKKKQYKSSNPKITILIQKTPHINQKKQL